MQVHQLARKVCGGCQAKARIGRCECGAMLCDVCRHGPHADCFDREYEAAQKASMARAEAIALAHTSYRKARKSRAESQLAAWLGASDS